MCQESADTIARTALSASARLLRSRTGGDLRAGKRSSRAARALADRRAGEAEQAPIASTFAAASSDGARVAVARRDDDAVTGPARLAHLADVGRWPPDESCSSRAGARGGLISHSVASGSGNGDTETVASAMVAERCCCLADLHPRRHAWSSSRAFVCDLVGDTPAARAKAEMSGPRLRAGALVRASRYRGRWRWGRWPVPSWLRYSLFGVGGRRAGLDPRHAGQGFMQGGVWRSAATSAAVPSATRSRCLARLLGPLGVCAHSAGLRPREDQRLRRPLRPDLSGWQAGGYSITGRCAGGNVGRDGSSACSVDDQPL
jgi:hypothetical protein